MKKIFAAWLAALLVGAAAPAYADVSILVDVFKNKDVNIQENVFETWNINFSFVGLEEGEFHITSFGGAEAKAIANVTNENNSVTPDETVTIAEGTEDETTALADEDRFHLDALIQNSIDGNRGEVQLNQDVGNNVNQGNLVSLAASNSGGAAEPEGSVGDSQAAVDQLNTLNSSRLVNEVLRDGDGSFEGDDEQVTDRTALIDTAITNNIGIVQVNQNAGDNNNQTNALSVALGLGGGLDSGPRFPLAPTGTFDGLGSLGGAVAISDAFLGQENTNNLTESINTIKFDTLRDSITGNSGIVSVNQTVGNMNNQGSVVSLAAGL